GRAARRLLQRLGGPPAAGDRLRGDGSGPPASGLGQRGSGRQPLVAGAPMLDPTRSRRLLRALVLWDRVRAKFRRKPSGREKAGQQLSAFYDRVWREAAAE